MNGQEWNKYLLNEIISRANEFGVKTKLSSGYVDFEDLYHIYVEMSFLFGLEKLWLQILHWEGKFNFESDSFYFFIKERGNAVNRKQYIDEI